MKLLGLAAYNNYGQPKKLSQDEISRILGMQDVLGVRLSKMWIITMARRNEETEKRLDEIFGDEPYVLIPKDRQEW
jgi:hypothetical protein